MRVIPCILLFVACGTGSVAAAPTAVVDGARLILRNDRVQRVLQRDGDSWRTISFARADGADVLAVHSGEFALRLMDGRELGIEDYVARAAPAIGKRDGAVVVTLDYRPRVAGMPGAPTAVQVEYWLSDGPVVRKRVSLAMAAGDAVDRLEVECFRTRLPCDRGGTGEPVFIGSAWFVGLEYPGSETGAREGMVRLAHFPGLARQDATGEWGLQSKVAVAGVGQPGDPLELGFSDYLATIRRPSRNFMQYNSWYDLRGNELTAANLVAIYEGFQRNLLAPYGLQMDAFVPDDGWQERDSIWLPRAGLYPTGFAPLRDALQARGTRLGIWMPLNGTNLNAAWGAAQGYEKSNRGDFYCLVGPRYNAAIREATRRVITQGNLAYCKHDFNTLRCSAPGHGHLPDDRHGHEANLDAELELLAYERTLNPDIFLNITSSVWLSPWWLMHADSVWMCASDFGFDRTFPQLSPREWEMSYRDAHFYHVYHDERKLVPVSAMMTHGIIQGKLNRLGGPDETLREWADSVVLYYGRGVQLKELYVTPDLLTPPWWEVLGKATRWAVDNCRVLENETMVGGSPRRGEVYGYAHWQGDRGILCLRNPGFAEQTLDVPFDKTVCYRGPVGRPFHGRVVYPYVAALPTGFTAGTPIRLSVPGVSVLVVELSRGAPEAAAPLTVPALAGGSARATVGEQGRATITARVPVPDEAMQRCDLYLVVQGPGRAAEFESLRVDGASIRPRRATGDTWALHSLDLRPFRGKTISLAAALPGPGDAPFSSPDVTVAVWLVADRPVTVRPLPAEHLPPAVAQGFRRQTVQLLAPTELPRRRQQRALSPADLATIKAARLRIRVFDVNGDPPYRDKFITLNGRQLASVPANRGELSAWQERIIELTPEQLTLLKLRNQLELGNAGGDCYKFAGLTLAVQLADGTWVESSTDAQVHTSVESWLYAEGKTFVQGTSGPVELVFGE